MKNIKKIKSLLKTSEESMREVFNRDRDEFDRTYNWDTDVDDDGNFKDEPEFNLKQEESIQEETFPVTMISEETAKLAEQEIGAKIENEHDGNYGYGGMYEFDDSTEYYIFDSYDEAESCAVQQVHEQLNSEPELFTQSWLQSHIDEETLERDILMDLEEKDERFYNENYPNDILGYLNDMYGSIEESGIKLDNYIDINSASQDAVDTDGVAHFLSGYDGNQIDLPNGGCMFRYN